MLSAKRGCVPTGTGRAFALTGGAGMRDRLARLLFRAASRLAPPCPQQGDLVWINPAVDYVIPRVQVERLADLWPEDFAPAANDPSRGY